MRSSWKVNNSIICESSLLNSNKGKVIMSRSFKVSPSIAHSGVSFFVHNGLDFVKVDLKGNGCNQSFGSFVVTKSLGRKIHIDKKKKK